MGVTVVEFVPIMGVHSEATACGNLLASEGLVLSEPMIFGLGSGLGFEYLERCDRRTGIREPLVFPDVRPGALMRNLSESTGMGLVVEETVSRDEARMNLFRRLRAGKPYGLKLDRFYLEYAEGRAHFNAHFITACGSDDAFLYVLDVGSEELKRTSLRNIEDARAAKGFMASKNMGFYFNVEGEFDLKEATRRALVRTLSEMVYCPSSFSGIRGIQRFAERLCKWRRNPNFRYQLLDHFLRWESSAGGSGGYRGLYSRFLEEASSILEDDNLRQASELYRMLGAEWSSLDSHLRELSLTENVAPVSLLEVAKAIRRQASAEAAAIRRIGLSVTS